MAFKLPDLPYAKDALAPHISAETLEFHHGKHHAAYVNRLNELIANTPNASASLEDIIRKAGPGALFNQAAQHFNHSFYWDCLKPHGGGEPGGKLGDAIKQAFGSFEQFKKQFTDACVGQFGSGWAWLVRKGDGSLAIYSTPNAECPLTRSDTPILTCDVWEHAYYIDYRNARPAYVQAFWNVVNWDFATANLK
ncbi:MAG TPA: superoxide dismutase [Candidatus Binataceae bacterium]|nr:superoxide dismutase [Candidatus Binataceae bacterium]